jgi:hypothetical protein
MARQFDGVQYEADVEVRPSDPLVVYRMEAAPQRFGLLKRFLAGELPDVPPDETDQSAPDPQAPTHVAKFRVNDAGGFEVYPSFKLLSQASAASLPASDILATAANKILRAVVPFDELSKATVEEGRVLSCATRIPGAKPVGTLKQQALLYISARRLVDGLPVDGPGSRIMVALDANEKVHGAVYEWKRPKRILAIPAPKKQEVLAEIERQLYSTEPRNGARVKRIELAYYDNGEALHPVYRYVAELGQDKQSTGAPDVTVSYVPFDPNADVPRLGLKPAETRRVGGLEGENAGAKTKLAVGRYTARNLSTGWAESSEAFRAVLEGASGPYTFVDHPADAEPAVFTTHKRDFVDAVDVALLEAHGFDMGFVTLSDDRDPLFVEKELQIGYGSGVQGKLKHWIWHSCTAVGTEADYPKWADHWGKVFSGLASVVGYRSVMFVSDGAPAALAASLAAGAPVASAWINAVTSLNIYARDSGVLLRCAGTQNLGRASAVVPSDYGNATAADAGPDEATSLESWWIEDAIHTPTGVIGVLKRNEEPCDGCPELGTGGPGNFPKRG